MNNKKMLSITVKEVNENGTTDFLYKQVVPYFPVEDLIDFVVRPYNYSKIPAMDYFIEGFKEALSMFPDISDKKRELFLQQALFKFENNEKSDNE